ncbi:MAG: acetylxylan esterase [Acidobacteriaceae bacterium]|nr:acetylxylan esterase [Acidobacteriaceae bacterium]
MTRTLFLLISTYLIAGQLWAQAVVTREGVLGSLTPIIDSIQRERGYTLDYEHKGNVSTEAWRQRGRDAVEKALSYEPEPTPLDVRVERTEKRSGYELRTISFAGSKDYRIPAFLLVPDTGKPPYPAVVGFHDHGGYFYFGKEKLVEVSPEHVSLTAFKKTYYGGRSWASELARRGFVVLVIDAFYWGERRLQYTGDAPAAWLKATQGLNPASPEYVDAANHYLEAMTGELNTQLSFHGINWIGIVNRDDRRSVDVLASLPFVDAKRIGCAGLSGGGFRATYMAGMEPRIRAAVVIGWMSTLPSIGHIAYPTHSDMYDAHGLHAFLDHPDVATLGAPQVALFVQDCGRDRLFTQQGMADAVAKIRDVYANEGHPERFRAQTYDVPHSFNTAMQEDAFTWLEKWLK